MKDLKQVTATRAPESLNMEERSVEFQITGPEADRHGTKVNMNNWKLDNFRMNPVVGYMHEIYGDDALMNSDPDRVIGTAEVRQESGPDGPVLIAKVFFESSETTGNQLADKIFNKIQAGTMRATSVGFAPIVKDGSVGYMGRPDEGEDPNLFYFHGQELLELSVVNIPSYPGATVRDTKSSLGETREGPYTPPAEVAAIAQEALNIREKEDVSDCGTRTGWTRANQLAKRQPVSMDTVKRIRSFLARHLAQVSGDLEDLPDTSCQKVMIYAWGGMPGLRWAERLIKEEDEESESSYEPESRVEPGELEVGNFCMWESSGGMARGRVDEIVTDGQIEVPDSDFTVNGTPDDPAALLTIFRPVDEDEELYEETDVQVAHRFSTLEKIDPLPIAPDEPEDDGNDEEMQQKLERAKMRDLDL